MPYYAVANGRKTGIYNTWDQCKSNTNGYPGAVYKKFLSKVEAVEFVKNGGSGGSRGAIGGGILKPSARSAPTKATHLPAVNVQQIYVDGAARGNGKHSTPKSGYGVYYGPGDSRNAAVPLSHVDDVTNIVPTNQRAELHALHHALNDIHKEIVESPEVAKGKKYEILTDSTYAKMCIESWAGKWKNLGWKTSGGKPVANKDIIEKAHDKYSAIYDFHGKIPITHVRGHLGIEGNEQADRLANEGADQM